MGKKKLRQPKRRRVSFSFRKPDAVEVSLVGDFNDWNPKRHPMKRDENGVWTKAVMLVPGTYEYKFWVDGNWMPDPQVPDVCKNVFGTLNNRLTVRPKATG